MSVNFGLGVMKIKQTNGNKEPFVKKDLRIGELSNYRIFSSLCINSKIRQSTKF